MLKSVLDDIQKEFKKKQIKNNIVYDLSKKYDAISSGSVIVDSVTGVGGLAVKGKLTEIFGFEGGGKTTLALQTCSQVQKSGGVAVFLDFEQAYDYAYGKALGLDMNHETFTVLQPMNAEEGEIALDVLVNKLGKAIDLIVIDSVAGCRPKSMFERKVGDSYQKAVHATYWTDFSSKLVGIASKHNIAILLINQIRMKPMMGQNDKFSVTNTGLGAGYSSVDNQISTTGGTALRFYLSARYLLVPVGQVKEQLEDEDTGEIIQERVANKVSIRNVKNKLAVPYKKTKFEIRFGIGTDDANPLKEHLKKQGIITTRGSHISYKSYSGELDFKENGKYRFDLKFRDPKVLEDAKLHYLNFDHDSELSSNDNHSENTNNQEVIEV